MLSHDDVDVAPEGGTNNDDDDDSLIAFYSRSSLRQLFGWIYVLYIYVVDIANDRRWTLDDRETDRRIANRSAGRAGDKGGGGGADRSNDRLPVVPTAPNASESFSWDHNDWPGRV